MEKTFETVITWNRGYSLDRRGLLPGVLSASRVGDKATGCHMVTFSGARCWAVPVFKRDDQYFLSIVFCL